MHHTSSFTFSVKWKISDGCTYFSQQQYNDVHNVRDLIVIFISLVSFSVLFFGCVYSNSRNDVPRVAQRYGTSAAHTRRRASVLIVFVVFCVHMCSFAGLIRRTPPPAFSDTAITDRHSDTTIFQLRAHWVRISCSIGSGKSFGHMPPLGVEPSTSCMQCEHPIH